jgi:large subunit ribosomal protein L25
MSTAMSEVRIAAEPRTEFGKGGARRTRRAGKVPAVLYGHGQPPRHIALPARELLHAFKTDAGTNVLLTLELGDGTELALPKEVQRHPVKGSFEHVDLVLVRRGEKVIVDVPVVLVGDAHPDTIVDQQQTTVSVKAAANRIPDGIQVSVAGLAPGSNITAGELALPAGAELDTDPATVVVQALVKPTAAQMEAEIEGGAAGAEAGASSAAETAGASA